MNLQMDLIDRSRTACLCDVGAPGFCAAVAIAEDGSEHLLLAEHSAIGDPDIRYDSTCPDAPHERLGALRPAMRARVDLMPLRCSWPTKSGRPCRNVVARPDGLCAHHTPRRRVG